MDLFARNVVGWHVADHVRAELVTTAFDVALGRRRVEPGVIFHSDRGSQYVSKALRTRLDRSRRGEALHAAPGPDSYMWRHEESLGAMIVTVGHGPRRDPKDPAALKALFHHELGLADGDDQPQAFVCTPNTTVFEWNEKMNQEHVWADLVEHHPANQERSDYAVIMMGGPAGSTYAPGGTVLRQLRDSITVRSLANQTPEGLPCSCPATAD